MDNKELKRLAKQKLKEFHRWRRVAGFHYGLIQVDENWSVKLFEFNLEDYKDRLHDWQREAPHEVNEIIQAVNAITTPRRRAALIMSYILALKLLTVEQMTRLGVASSSYHRAKEQALLEFAEHYRQGVLKTYYIELNDSYL